MRVPVGVPAPGATASTVAEKVARWPATDGSGATESAVAVAALPTVWVRAWAVLAWKIEPPAGW